MQSTDNDRNPFLNKEYRQFAWDTIISRIDKKENTGRAWYLYASAAVTVLAISLLVIYLQEQKTGRLAPAIASYKKIINATEDSSVVILEDGSKVTLYPASEIIFRQPMGDTSREINLSGKALFDVAHDKTRPFSVLSNNIKTTALGTSFTVLSDSLSNSVNVFLHSGKVMVQRSDKEEIVYLSPGQHVNCNINFTAPFVQRSSAPGKILPVAKMRNKKSIVQQEYIFNQEPLSNVLNKLSSGFDIHLDYYPKELNNLYFSGKISPTDKPINVLRRIAALHDLTLTTDQKGFSLRKN